MAVYAVDFDGTLAVTRFPEIIGPRKKVVAAVKILKASGHKIILWTSKERQWKRQWNGVRPRELYLML